jgi:CBS domain-containing protein
MDRARGGLTTPRGWHDGCFDRCIMANPTAESIMSRDLVTCCASDSLNVAAKHLWEHDIGALPVTDERGCAVGMITDRDIAMAAYTQGQPLEQIPVHSAMSKQLWSVPPSAPVAQVEQLMQEHQVRRIAVVDEQRRPVGMISLNDLALCAGSPRTAPVATEEVAQTLRAVSMPRPEVPRPHAVAE